MLRVTMLGSGSRGNAMLLEGADTTVLVDAGFGVRALARRLAMVGKRPEAIDALLLTHEHTDHASGALACCARWKWPLYATAGTLGELPESTTPTLAVRVHSAFAVGGLSVVATPVPHDAREAVALVVTDRASGCRIGIATDLGHVPATLPAQFERLDVLVVESNHDEQMLANGPYPWVLKRRIGGQLGHLSNGQAAAFAAGCVHKGLRAVVLAHLSETNNTPEAAIACGMAALRKSGWKRDALWAAHQTHVRGPYASTGSDVPIRTVQLALGF